MKLWSQLIVSVKSHVREFGRCIQMPNVVLVMILEETASLLPCIIFFYAICQHGCLHVRRCWLFLSVHLVFFLIAFVTSMCKWHVIKIDFVVM